MPKTKDINTDPADVLTVPYPCQLVRRHETKNGGVFHSVSFRFKDAWASFVIGEDKIKPYVRNGETVNNKVSLELGPAEDIRMVSVSNNGKGFKNQAFFNRSIQSYINQAKSDYLKSVAI